MLRVGNLLEEGKVGGPQVRIVNVAQILDGVETIVIAPPAKKDGFQQLCERKQVPFVGVRLSRITKELSVALRFVFCSFYEVFLLRKVFRQQQVDLVHASGGSWQFKGVIAARLAGKKVLWHLNDTSVPQFVKAIFKRISPLADGFIFASERTRNYYSPFIPPGKKSYLIPAPVDTEVFDPDKVQAADLGLPADTLVVGMVANINRLKGLDVLVRTAAELKEEGPPMAFVVVGPVFDNQQGYFDSIQQLAKELDVSSLRFVGGQQDVRAWVAAFDVYLCTSRAESSPISVWEAMALGKAVVSTDVGDVAKYVGDGEGGFIAENENHKALAGGLKKLGQDSSLLFKMGQRNRRVACEQLDLAFCAERHRAAYEDILNNKTKTEPETGV